MTPAVFARGARLAAGVATIGAWVVSPVGRRRECSGSQPLLLRRRGYGVTAPNAPEAVNGSASNEMASVTMARRDANEVAGRRGIDDLPTDLAHSVADAER
jgi:hypothetical protein